jgi:HPt (histidine-containing phosphotransfer) domain-containing protein
MGTVTDLTFIKSFTGGDNAKIKKYVGMFLNMAPASMEQMEKQLAESDWKSMKTTSHSIKSQMKYMGMANGAEICQSIENICAESSGTDALPELLSRLKTMVHIGISELEAEISSL